MKKESRILRSYVLMMIAVCLWSFGIQIGCSMFKPIAKTTNEIARVLCEEYATGRDTAGMSVKDWCSVHENLYPFIDAVTGLEKAGVAQ